MDIENAIEILGINRTKAGDLQPMVRALSLCGWLNTAEDNERLEAARHVLRRWSVYQEACNKARDLRIRRVG